MTETDLYAIASDTTSTVDFTVGVVVQNGRLTGPQRAAITNMVLRHAKALQVQLEMFAPDRCDVSLDRRSSTTGTAHLDIGWSRPDE